MAIRKKPILKDESTSTNQPQISRKELINSVIKRKQKSKFLSDNQKDYYDILINNQITICSGPAGVGKSYISMKAAVDLLMDPNNSYEKIIIVRPAVEAEEKLGSLPGNLEEKLDPYIFPSYYLLNKIIGKEAREKLKEYEVIEVFALAYMRGMNIDNSILIFEEGQNATPNQMKMLLTRIGEGSRMVVTGDLAQADRLNDNGLINFCNLLGGKQVLKHVDIVQFNAKDIERHNAVKEVLALYGDS